jgi:hypothetical protein
MGGLIQLIVVLVILGVGLYLVETYVPMAAPMKTIIRVVVILVVVLWLLQVFGVMNMTGPRLHN